MIKFSVNIFQRFCEEKLLQGISDYESMDKNLDIIIKDLELNIKNYVAKVSQKYF
jgi:hypothetical protein